MTRVIDAVLALRGIGAYAVVGLLAFVEAGALVGLLVPGELAVLLGGVLASRGQVSLPAMVGVAAAAAILGDSAGYEFGRHLGPRLLRSERFVRRFGGRLERASAYVNDRGGAAVFAGRWTSVLRALVPGIAGMARMPYGRFLAYNVVGGVLWATTFVVLGYLAGASYQRVERIAGRASLLLVVAIALVVGVRWVVHRVAARREWLRAIRDRALAWPAVRWMTGHWGTQLDWLGRRLDRRARAGLGLTITVSALTAATWVIGVAVQDLLAGEELALLDGPVNRALAPYRTVAALDVARIVLAAVELPWVGLLAVVLAGSAWRASGRAAALRLVGGAALTVIVALALRGVLPVTSVGTRFPSVQTTVAAAFAVSLTTAFARRGWAAGTRAATAATVAVALVAFAALVDTDSALSGVVGGAGLGSLLALVLEVPTRLRSPLVGATGGTPEP